LTDLITVIPARAEALQSAPLPRDWVLGGDPRAYNQVLSKSADGLAFTMLWRCTAGAFRWRYDEDETIQVTKGGMRLVFDDGSVRDCSVGDVVYFRAGSSCVWIISDEVSKIAFFRQPTPSILALPLRLWRLVARKLDLYARFDGAPGRLPPRFRENFTELQSRTAGSMRP
jgi:hypothetical protein